MTSGANVGEVEWGVCSGGGFGRGQCGGFCGGVRVIVLVAHRIRVCCGVRGCCCGCLWMLFFDM